MTDQTKRDARNYWNEFSRITHAKTVADLSSDAIQTYKHKIYRNATSPSYIRARFTTVKTILNYGLKQGQDIDNTSHALLLCKALSPPSQNGVNPQPISRKHYRALLAKADSKWRAILLLSLNAAYYPVDVARAEWDDLDLAGRTLVSFRQKTGVPRIAMLWIRTVKALKALPKTGKLVFTRCDGRSARSFQHPHPCCR
ncbi:MAG: hypothetical protein QUV05_20040 [Phycisphaerae bacterium]|nr:hypothetical protein [Phycisphaerae bacterium]